MAPVTQLTLLKLKPDSHLDEAGSPAGDALLDVISAVKKTDASTRVFFGRQLENPDIGVLAAVFPSLAASESFSTASAPKLSAFSLSALTRTAELSPAESVAGVFTAPTTEVATGYGAEEGYEKNMRRFAELLDGELKGKDAAYHGIAVGATVGDISKEEGGEKGKAVMLVVGWDSREAHLKRKDEGVIPDNIHLIRGLRKDMGMWHVSFKEY